MNHIYPINTQGRDFFLGDLHGCYDVLQQGLKDVNFDYEKDRLFSVGDLIDRGPKSQACLDLIYEPWFHATMGNHEQFMVEACHDRDIFVNWYNEGGVWGSDLTMDEHKAYAKDINTLMPFYMVIETQHGRVGIVHAEPPRDWANIEHSDPDDLLWNREKIKAKDTTVIKNIDYVLCGHTPDRQGPIILGNTAYIDIYTVGTGKLALFTLDQLFDLTDKETKDV